MKNVSEIIGLSVISIQEGEECGNIRELLVDPNDGSIKYLVIQDDDWYFGAKIIAFSDIQGIGMDAVTTLTKQSIHKLEECDEAVNLVKKQVTVINSKVYTQKGKLIGKVDEYFIDETTGNITGFSVYVQNVKDSRQMTISADDIVTYGMNVVIVKQNIVENTQAVEGEPSTKIGAGENREFSEDIVKDASKLFEIRQKEYFKGKKLSRDIIDDDGRIIERAGAIITEELIDKTKKAGRFIELTMSVEE